MRRLLATLTLAAVASGAGGCSILQPRQPLVLPPGAMPLATYDFDPGPDVPILCTLGRALDPVVGRLAGDPARAPHPMWLVGSDGRETHVPWPRGFSGRFTTSVELLGRTGEVVADGGDPLDLNLNRADAAGTVEDPYEVWWINGDCYPPIH
jgi:hypothetical protein